MNERRMLELAAKAAGYEPARWADLLDALMLVGEQEPWNPLTDDGDAFRLAVKLGLALSVEYQFGSTAVLWGPPTGFLREPHNGDPNTATRLAVVRAAAAIGEQREG